MGEAKRRGSDPSRYRLGDAPIQPEYRELMNQTAEALDQFFNGSLRGSDRKIGYVLLTFPFGEVQNSRCNFISNGADRRDVVTLMKEMIARFEGQPETTGTA